MIPQQIAGAARMCGLPAAMLAAPAGGTESQACRVDLVARASAAPAARRHLMEALRAWRLEALADSAQLVTSELVTNAVKASHNGLAPHPDGLVRTVVVTFARASGGLRVEVWDESAAPPVISEPEQLDEGGRGLCLVNVLARDWGYRSADGGGKIVWCEIA